MRTQYKIGIDQRLEGGGEERREDLRNREGDDSRVIPGGENRAVVLGTVPESGCRGDEEVIDALSMWSSLPDLQSKVWI